MQPHQLHASRGVGESGLDAPDVGVTESLGPSRVAGAEEEQPAELGRQAPQHLAAEVAAEPSATSPGPEEALRLELEEQRRRATELTQIYRKTLLERELATALSGQPIVPAAARQLIQLWRDEFEVVEQDGVIRIASRDGRSVSDAVSAWLSQPEYAHFCRAPSRGGTSLPPGPTGVAGGATSPQPKTLGELAIQRWREACSASRDPVAPIGLSRRRRV